jgi:hypothetical protein
LVAIFGLLQYVLQFANISLCQFWHTIGDVPGKPIQPRKLIWLVDSLARLTGFPHPSHPPRGSIAPAKGGTFLTRRAPSFDNRLTFLARQQEQPAEPMSIHLGESDPSEP